MKVCSKIDAHEDREPEGAASNPVHDEEEDFAEFGGQHSIQLRSRLQAQSEGFFTAREQFKNRLSLPLPAPPAAAVTPPSPSGPPRDAALPADMAALWRRARFMTDAICMDI